MHLGDYPGRSIDVISVDVTKPGLAQQSDVSNRSEKIFQILFLIYVCVNYVEIIKCLILKCNKK